MQGTIEQRTRTWRQEVTETFRTGKLPSRYSEPWRAPFDTRVKTGLRPGMSILDVGSGRSPTLPLSTRPPGCSYVGLDISLSELQKAGIGAYDEMVVANVMDRMPQLEGKFDLVISWQVLEHVKRVDVAIDNLRAYLKPGGRFIAQMSGTFSAFGLINRIVPQRFGVWAMHRLLNRAPDTVFPAYYHLCWYSALDQILRPWSQAEIVPRYLGAGYFRFLRSLQGLYIAYEEWTYRRSYQNLASYYLIDAIK